eukprot:CAMPEP_0172390996 /NCGR_PEP_ID=MMETSP1061-20121228/7519_1 /TAXON_ID=37318 /ORGANISM="Pseudo-nitzschia pungens, Strain cf. pungens" /LENGTH=422 /DNA_ID=CAMNT_0013121517 /DNA_START=35 /DNA_END=1303 /DNA_ORIENTATION=-
MGVMEDSMKSNSGLISAEFDAKYGRPKENDYGYQVVGRLSRWEGGNATPYHETDAGRASYREPEKITIWKFLKQFFKPEYDLTEVTVEDIERVKLMHDRFMGDTHFNFNYSTLLVIASVIAGVGLGSNSSASIIASMLVSPLMGPVTAMAYGISIGDFKMVRMAFVTEVTSLAICIIIGLIIAGCMKEFSVADGWPTDEMSSRTERETFLCGVPIAFFSGLGVAVGLLDSQTNSLVGVAISASLLPPAVNAGMLWVIHSDFTEREHEREQERDREHEFYVSEHLIGGTASLCLTIMNIAVIIVASMFMFRLKETLPIEKSIFWTDLGVARKIYHNVAIVPILQDAPDESEIKKRVTMFFPRASTIVAPLSMLGDSVGSNGSEPSSLSTSRKKVEWNSNVEASSFVMAPIEEMRESERRREEA